jgi:hypothetical protein
MAELAQITLDRQFAARIAQLLDLANNWVALRSRSCQRRCRCPM